MDPVDPKNGSFARCSKHPSQFFTGFCSYCLVEKLSSVGSSDTSSNTASSSQSEIVETTPDGEKKPCQISARKTLLSLFQMDDSKRNVTNVWSSGGVDCAKILHLEVNSDRKAKDSLSHNDAAGIVGSDSHGERKLKGRGISFRWSSVLSGRGLRYRTGDDHKRNQSMDKVLHDEVENKQLERKPSLRMYYCDWMACCESSRSSWELPRHSWDGSMVSRALSCSCACLEAQQDDLRRTRGSMREEPMSGNLEKVCNGNANGGTSADERSLSSEGSSLGSLFRDGTHDEPHPEVAASDFGRRKSRGWSKVWDRSITSPLSDFIKKGENVLERSLSESWKGTRKSKKIGTMKSNGQIQVKKNGLAPARENPCAHRRINTANLRPDLAKKRECMFGRSRTVHYSSPANLDNGLLRFYLTPLRSSRSTNKGRRKGSHSFAKGLFGLH
ncbi:uncharacterized protein [Typha latifolia]|uniref:uncharacterized protein isoform X1 n=2 Tax=Typha latifolia TaxID=4733 RepID=UPI003C30CF85